MHYAVRPWPDSEEQIHILHSLFERKASVNAKNVLGETPLHAAVMRSASPAVVLWLLDRRADPDIMCVRRFREVGNVEPQNTALHYVGPPPHPKAIIARNTEVVRLLLKFGVAATPNDVGETPAKLIHTHIPDTRVREELLSLLGARKQ